MQNFDLLSVLKIKHKGSGGELQVQETLKVYDTLSTRCKWSRQLIQSLDFLHATSWMGDTADIVQGCWSHSEHFQVHKTYLHRQHD